MTLTQSDIQNIKEAFDPRFEKLSEDMQSGFANIRNEFERVQEGNSQEHTALRDDMQSGFTEIKNELEGIKEENSQEHANFSRLLTQGFQKISATMDHESRIRQMEKTLLILENTGQISIPNNIGV